jgi:hypothetical protein
LSGRVNNFWRKGKLNLIIPLITSKFSFCIFKEILSGNLPFNCTCKWTTLTINQCIAFANMVKFQLSVLKSEFIYFYCCISSSKVQFGKQLPPLLLTFPAISWTTPFVPYTLTYFTVTLWNPFAEELHSYLLECRKWRGPVCNDVTFPTLRSCSIQFNLTVREHSTQ